MTSLSILPTQVKQRPLLITLGIHALLLLVLLLWKFSMPAQPAPVLDFGMEVNLGTGETGSGADQPMDVEDPAVSFSKKSGASSPAGLTDIARSDDEEAPGITTGARTGIHNDAVPARHQAGTAAGNAAQQLQTQKPRFIYPGSRGQGGNSTTSNRPGTGEGIAGGPGDQGVPSGTPGATAYSGTPGNGTGGYSFSLAGRTIERAPTEGERFREGGKVVVRVTVNRDGEIVNKLVKSTTNSELNSIALRRLLHVRFNKSETAPEEQFGTITFVFKTRQ